MADDSERKQILEDEALPLLTSWTELPHGFKLSIVTVVFGVLFPGFITLFSAHSVRMQAVERVYGSYRHNSTVPLVIVAQRGFSSDYASNTPAAFCAALPHTQHIKTDAIRTIDGKYLIIARDDIDEKDFAHDPMCQESFDALRNRTCRPFETSQQNITCGVEPVVNATLAQSCEPILTLNETIQFAIDYNVTLYLEFHSCYRRVAPLGEYSAYAEQSRNQPNDTTVAIELYDRAMALGLPPEQWRFIYTQRPQAVALYEQRNVSLDHMLWKMPTWQVYSPVTWRGQDAVVQSADQHQVDTALQVQAFPYGVWFGYKWNYVTRDTWIHVVELERRADLEYSILYSPARSIQVSDPRQVVEFANEHGIPYLAPSTQREVVNVTRPSFESNHVSQNAQNIVILVIFSALSISAFAFTGARMYRKESDFDVD